MSLHWELGEDMASDERMAIAVEAAMDQSANPYTDVQWDSYQVEFLGRKWDRYWVKVAVDSKGVHYFAIRDMWAKGGDYSDYRPMPHDDIAVVMTAIREVAGNR